MEKLLTVPQVSERLQVSQSLVYKWVHYDLVPHIKLGTLLRFEESKLERWVNNKRRKGRSTYRIEL